MRRTECPHTLPAGLLNGPEVQKRVFQFLMWRHSYHMTQNFTCSFIHRRGNMQQHYSEEPNAGNSPDGTWWTDILFLLFLHKKEWSPVATAGLSFESVMPSDEQVTEGHVWLHFCEMARVCRWLTRVESPLVVPWYWRVESWEVIKSPGFPSGRIELVPDRLWWWFPSRSVVRQWGTTTHVLW